VSVALQFWQIVLLAAVQGAAELLPVSSSAHVIVAERLMGLDPSSPELTFLLVMLHTGTMFAVLVYFWKRWAALLKAGTGFIRALVIATAVTGVVGLVLKVAIEKVLLEKILGHSKGEVETLFQYLPLIATSLFVVGLYIIYSGRKYLKQNIGVGSQATSLTHKDSAAIGLIQALCLPFRGLSRSGSTISTALLRGVPRALAEDFSFALAVILTPPVILLELRRLLKTQTDLPALTAHDLVPMLQPGLIGLVFSFIAGLLALKWLSRWLEAGKWTYFGYYCLVASITIFALWGAGF
jgi:undecaprenyl-diphosphatase